jgi:phospholipid-binding lipoprotein MlaA
MMLGWRCRLSLAIAALMLLQGCASLKGPDPTDPLEPLNRKITAFNDMADDVVLRPVAVVYGQYLPTAVRMGIGNFFSNQSDVMSFFNSLAQLKFDLAAKNAMRVGINSTLGIGGILDWATLLKIDKHKEDFGQTLSFWGVSSGPYVVLPFFGPSTVRDSFGFYVDVKTDINQQLADTSSRNVLSILRLTDKRERYLSLSDAVRQASLDPYTFTRDAYLQKRLNDIYDGNPPVMDDFDDPDQPSPMTAPNQPGASGRLDPLPKRPPSEKP